MLHSLRDCRNSVNEFKSGCGQFVPLLNGRVTIGATDFRSTAYTPHLRQQSRQITTVKQNDVVGHPGVCETILCRFSHVCPCAGQVNLHELRSFPALPYGTQMLEVGRVCTTKKIEQIPRRPLAFFTAGASEVIQCKSYEKGLSLRL
jgi:hypothetical protein